MITERALSQDGFIWEFRKTDEKAASVECEGEACAEIQFRIIPSSSPNVPMKVYMRNDSGRDVAIRYRTMALAGCSALNTVRLGPGGERTIDQPYQFGICTPVRANYE